MNSQQIETNDDQVEIIFPNLKQSLPANQKNRLHKDPKFLSEQVEVFNKKNQTFKVVPETLDAQNSDGKPLKFVSSRPLFVYRNDEKKKQQQNHGHGYAPIIFLEILLHWSNFHKKVAVHSVPINSNYDLDVHVDPSMQIPSIENLPINENPKPKNRVLVFRPLHVYRQQQKEKENMRIYGHPNYQYVVPVDYWFGASGNEKEYAPQHTESFYNPSSPIHIPSHHHTSGYYV
ncbi:hypothetical protein Bhyg_07319 [Pseudolycoriella hygida]|uniref:Uncharacterized protein n=1 Tax=Pseudolycoriella hygida TaxID=35572 RepID=A0A9Q0N3D2_9DIPT|nr:hypothetical protein Bhyg_07319 [Pseudolycoriella hygida]